VRKKLFAANRGFVTVNDAPALASQLARYLTRTGARPSTIGRPVVHCRLLRSWPRLQAGAGASRVSRRP
jgi:hypothetical protein